MASNYLRDLDCYYTKPKIAKKCLEFLHRKFAVDSAAHWLEPAAGNGSFFERLPIRRRTGIDLVANIELGIERADFLQWSPSVDAKQIITVGNPPFGKNASLAVKFFNHAAGFSNCIAMILPRTFRKDSVINRLDRKFHLVNEMEIPEYSFTLGDSPIDVPCVFQIWEKRRSFRKIIVKPKSHADFRFSHSSDADFAVQRVGMNAGRIKKQFGSVSPNSHYFIKSVEILEKVLQIFREIEWNAVKFNTAGNPSISRSDVVFLYEEHKELAMNMGFAAN